jgi:hypothetical protein
VIATSGDGFAESTVTTVEVLEQALNPWRQSWTVTSAGKLSGGSVSLLSFRIGAKSVLFTFQT